MRINENPDKICVPSEESYFADYYEYDSDGTIPFIVDKNLTDMFIGYECDTHGGVMDDIYFDYQDNSDGRFVWTDEHENTWDRQNGFHGRLWKNQKVINFWKQPSPSQLTKILSMFDDFDEISSNEILNNYKIEVSDGEFIPVKDYLNGGKAEVDNNFDLSTVHTKVGETTPEMQAYLKNRSSNRGNKLGKPNNKREVTPAEYNYYLHQEDKKRNKTKIIKENPEEICVPSENGYSVGYYEYYSNGAVPFIVDSDLTNMFIGHERSIHGRVMDDIYDYYQDNTDEDFEWTEEHEDKWETNAFHGRLWKNQKVINFWKQPTPYQLSTIIKMFDNFDGISSNEILNNYKIEVSDGEFIPVRNYLKGVTTDIDNDFDRPTVHTKIGLSTPEMQAYLRNRSSNQSNKLGKPNNKREVTPAEYNYYRKYGMGESINRGRMTLYHGTDYWGMLNVITNGVIDARKGRQTGETKGMNWFFTEYRDNYSRGYVFSIDISEEELKSYDGHPMSNITVATYDPIPIANHNFRIVEAFGIGYETIQRMWDIAGKKVEDEYERIFLLIERMQKLSIARDNELIDINHPIIEQLLKQLLGINKMKEFGILENKQINEVEAEDLRLKSFEVKDELHPKFWINDKLNSRVRLRLLDIADDFIDSLAVDWVKPKDVVFTGSLANYNWSKYSDIDLHIIMKYSDVYKKTEFVEDYFKGKKDLWANEHENLKIYGYPVEVFVEDSENEAASTGVYSLYKNKWVKKPDDFQNAELNEEYIKRYASKLMTKIDDFEEKLKDEKDEHKIETVHNKLTALAKKIKNMRQESLKKSGEMGSGNIIFKLLRRTDYIKKMYDLINSSYDSINSIKENKV